MNATIKKQGISKVEQFIDVKWANVTSIFALIFIFGKSVLIPKKILGSFSIAIIVAIGSLVMVPYYFSYGATINLSLFLISSFVYGSIFYSFRRSTLFDNLRETNLSKIAIYFSIFVVMAIFTAFIYLFIISSFIIGLAINTNLFMTDWFFRNYNFGSGGYWIGGLNAQLMIWWFVAFICLNFSLFYLFQNIANSQKTFYLFVFFYLILLMLYGNSINTPYLGYSFSIVEKYPILAKVDNFDIIYNYYFYKDLLLIPNYDYPFDVSFHITISDMIQAKFENGHYLTAIISLLTPHYWINIYSANIMKATCLRKEIFDPIVTLESCPESWTGITNYINDFKLPYLCPIYNFKHAKIWSLQNEIGWVLGMYLWMAYFIFFYFIGMCFSKLNCYKK